MTAGKLLEAITSHVSRPGRSRRLDESNESKSIHDRSLISEYLSGLERLAQSKRHQTHSRFGQASRAISTGQLRALLRFHTQPIELLVSECSSGTNVQGDLVLRSASHLDAFSGYPIRT